jgi:GTPase-associated protein 1, N-terminal domain type 1
VIETVDQLLFGYRDGHELIAGSCRLHPAHLRDVLAHVDAAVESDDERQLVGTWLESLEAYLLARIWAAPERPRPGAVWAHVVLISGAQLNQGRTTNLVALLRRPAERDLGGYDERLAWPADRRAETAPVPVPLAHALAAAAHAADGRPRIVLWPTPADAEDALVALLDSMPPALRRGLSFRTRERARWTGWPYRVQVAGSVSGRATEEAALVVDARPRPAS